MALSVPTWPLSLRTGVEPVDRILNAVESDRTQDLSAAIDYIPVPCKDPSLPRSNFAFEIPCSPGEVSGQSVDVFIDGGLDRVLRRGEVVSDELLARLVGIDASLYAVAADPDAGILRFRILFLRPLAESGFPVVVTYGVTNLGLATTRADPVHSLDSLYSGQQWLLPPRR